MEDTQKQNMRKHLTDNEGYEQTPYKDSNDHLTTGVGFNIDSESAFLAFKFLIRDTQSGQMREASTAEKSAERARLNAISQKEIEKEQKDKKARLFLPVQDIDAELAKRIDAHEKGAIAQWGVALWNRLTDGRKRAMIDIHFANPDGLARFPKLKAAAEAGDVAAMARESDFHGGDIPGSPHKVRNFDRIRQNRTRPHHRAGPPGIPC